MTNFKKSLTAIGLLAALTSPVYATDYVNKVDHTTDVNHLQQQIDNRVKQADYEEDKYRLQEKIKGLDYAIDQNAKNTTVAQHTADDAKQTAIDANNNADAAKQAADAANSAASDAQKTANQTQSDLTQHKEDYAKDSAKVQDQITDVKSDVTAAQNAAQKAQQTADSKVDQSAYEDNNKVVKDNIAAAEKNANDYTDSKVSHEVGEARDYAKTEANRAETNAMYYATEAVDYEAGLRQQADAETLNSAKAYTNQKFAELDKRIGKVRDEANAGTASALAASQIPQVEATGRYSLGAGIGGYNGQSAVAVGMSARVNGNTVTKFAVTTDSQHNFGFGAGLAVSW